MEEKKSPLLKSSLNNGIILGIISILISVIVWVGGFIESMGIFGSAIIGVITLIINFIILFIFAKNYRNKEFEGYISFKEAFKFVFLVIIFATVITIIYNYIFHKFIAPDYMANLYAVMEQKLIVYLENMGATEEIIDNQLKQFDEIPSIWKTLRQSLLFGVIGGVIISLIVAAIVKKNDEVPE